METSHKSSRIITTANRQVSILVSSPFQKIKRKLKKKSAVISQDVMNIPISPKPKKLRITNPLAVQKEPKKQETPNPQIQLLKQLLLERNDPKFIQKENINRPQLKLVEKVEIPQKPTRDPKEAREYIKRKKRDEKKRLLEIEKEKEMLKLKVANELEKIEQIRKKQRVLQIQRNQRLESKKQVSKVEEKDAASKPVDVAAKGQLVIEKESVQINTADKTLVESTIPAGSEKDGDARKDEPASVPLVKQEPVPTLPKDKISALDLNDTTKVLKDSPKILNEKHIPKSMDDANTNFLKDSPKIVNDTTKVLKGSPKILNDTTKVIKESPKILNDTKKVPKDTTRSLNMDERSQRQIYFDWSQLPKETDQESANMDIWIEELSTNVEIIGDKKPDCQKLPIPSIASNPEPSAESAKPIPNSTNEILSNIIDLDDASVNELSVEASTLKNPNPKKDLDEYKLQIKEKSRKLLLRIEELAAQVLTEPCKSTQVSPNSKDKENNLKVAVKVQKKKELPLEGDALKLQRIKNRKQHRASNIIKSFFKKYCNENKASKKKVGDVKKDSVEKVKAFPVKDYEQHKKRTEAPKVATVKPVYIEDYELTMAAEEMKRSNSKKPVDNVLPVFFDDYSPILPFKSPKDPLNIIDIFAKALDQSKATFQESQKTKDDTRPVPIESKVVDQKLNAEKKNEQSDPNKQPSLETKNDDRKISEEIVDLIKTNAPEIIVQPPSHSAEYSGKEQIVKNVASAVNEIVDLIKPNAPEITVQPPSHSADHSGKEEIVKNVSSAVNEAIQKQVPASIEEDTSKCLQETKTVDSSIHEAISTNDSISQISYSDSFEKLSLEISSSDFKQDRNVIEIEKPNVETIQTTKEMPPVKEDFKKVEEYQTATEQQNKTKHEEPIKINSLLTEKLRLMGQEGKRLTPMSLSKKLEMEIALFTAIDESRIQLSELEKNRSVAIAQHESVALIQMLVQKEKQHQLDLENAKLAAQIRPRRYSAVSHKSSVSDIGNYSKPLQPNVEQKNRAYTPIETQSLATTNDIKENIDYIDDFESIDESLPKSESEKIISEILESELQMPPAQTYTNTKPSIDPWKPNQGNQNPSEYENWATAITRAILNTWKQEKENAEKLKKMRHIGRDERRGRTKSDSSCDSSCYLSDILLQVDEATRHMSTSAKKLTIQTEKMDRLQKVVEKVNGGKFLLEDVKDKIKRQEHALSKHLAELSIGVIPKAKKATSVSTAPKQVEVKSEYLPFDSQSSSIQEDFPSIASNSQDNIEEDLNSDYESDFEPLEDEPLEPNLQEDVIKATDIVTESMEQRINALLKIKKEKELIVQKQRLKEIEAGLLRDINKLDIEVSKIRNEDEKSEHVNNEVKKVEKPEFEETKKIDQDSTISKKSVPEPIVDSIALIQEKNTINVPEKNILLPNDQITEEIVEDLDYDDDSFEEIVNQDELETKLPDLPAKASEALIAKDSSEKVVAASPEVKTEAPQTANIQPTEPISNDVISTEITAKDVPLVTDELEPENIKKNDTLEVNESQNENLESKSEPVEQPPAISSKVAIQDTKEKENSPEDYIKIADIIFQEMLVDVWNTVKPILKIPVQQVGKKPPPLNLTNSLKESDTVEENKQVQIVKEYPEKLLETKHVLLKTLETKLEEHYLDAPNVRILLADFGDRNQEELLLVDSISEAIDMIFEPHRMYSKPNREYYKKQILKPSPLSKREILFKLGNQLDKWIKYQTKHGEDSLPMITSETLQEQRYWDSFDPEETDIKLELAEILWSELLDDTMHTAMRLISK